jgi:hypothetical protein
MHRKQRNSNNLHHRENTDRDHQVETEKEIMAAEVHRAARRPNSVHNLGGTLVDDVVIGEFARPWNAKSDSGSLAAGIPKESLWAYDEGGVNQIGCIYTAQGFEFDYVGVIFGPDLVYVPEVADWKGDKTKSYDTVVKRSGDRFTQMVKNTYRVLLTRGMKDCYVHFMDKGTENFFRSRMEHSGKGQ